MTGWKCPGCGACYSLMVTECRHCQPKVVPATTTNWPWRYIGGTPLPKLPENTCGH